MREKVINMWWHISIATNRVNRVWSSVSHLKILTKLSLLLVVIIVEMSLR